MRRSERLALAAFGYVLVLAATFIAPRTARATAFPVETPRNDTLPSAPATRRFEDAPPLDIARDPFVSEGGNESVATAAPSTAPLFPQAAALRGGSPAIRTVPRRPMVRALVAGPHPYALVEIDGAVQIVAPGDALLGKRVAQIDLDGILFEGGARMTLTVPAP
jgi:hypothetical protein